MNASAPAFTIAALRQRLARGEISHEALVADVLERASQPSAAHVFTTVYSQGALAAARHADALQRAGVTLPALAGLPVTIKDLYDVAGEVTLAGSVVRRDAAPAEHVGTSDLMKNAQARSGNFFIGSSDDPGCKDSSITGSIDRHGSNRNTSWHLDNGQQ